MAAESERRYCPKVARLVREGADGGVCVYIPKSQLVLRTSFGRTEPEEGRGFSTSAFIDRFAAEIRTFVKAEDDKQCVRDDAAADDGAIRPVVWTREERDHHVDVAIRVEFGDTHAPMRMYHNHGDPPYDVSDSDEDW